LSANNTIAQQGADADGTIPVNATFTPDLETYAFVPKSKSGEIYLNAYTNISTTKPAVTTKFTPLKSIGRYPLEFYKNITNQPIFTKGDTCDNQITLFVYLFSPKPFLTSGSFNTTLTTGNNIPVGIRGKVSILPPYFPEPGCDFNNVYGVKVDVAFVENTGVNCSLLKGYSGTGPGD
jgi:hypothetical protein